MSGARPRGETIGRLLERARFELVPTATVQGSIASLPSGSTATVTVSPRRGLDPTVALCERLSADGFRAVPHLTARLVRSRDHLAELADRLTAAGICEVFVVGGDVALPAGPFPSALSLLVALEEMGHRFEDVGVAGYPERHPLVDDRTMLRALLDKQDHATYLVTQICYDPSTILAWIGRIRQAKVRLSVYVGMPGVVNRAKLLRISLHVGVGDSLRYLRRHGGLVGRLLGRNAWRPGPFVERVAAMILPAHGDVIGLHLNTFNQVGETERWRRELLHRAGWVKADPAQVTDATSERVAQAP